MWTETHYYRFDSQAQAEAMELPELCAVDLIGPIREANWHLNIRWWGTEPLAWAAYRLPAPSYPKRIFA
jgi:hypothetical protein